MTEPASRSLRAFVHRLLFREPCDAWKRARERELAAYRELKRVEAIRADVEQTLHLIASHPHGGLLANIARVKLQNLGAKQ